MSIFLHDAWRKTMSIETEVTRQKALESLRSSGVEWSRVGKGQRYLVAIVKDGVTSKALVKVASRGSAMFRTSSDDAEAAELSGFGSDINYVLFAVGYPNDRFEKVEAYLVPVSVVDAAVRRSHSDWRNARPDSNPSQTWVIWFNASGAKEANNFADKWKEYRCGTSLTLRGDGPQEEPLLTLAEAKRQLAQSLGVDQDRIKITIEA